MIIRSEHKKDFTIINNQCLKDITISTRAKGLFAYLLSLPDDWKIYRSELINHFSDGEHSINRTLKELEQKGYIKKERTHNKIGRYDGWKYTIYEIPSIGKPRVGENPESVKTPSRESRTQENPKSTNQDLLSTNSILSTKDKYYKNNTNTNPKKGFEEKPSSNSLLSEKDLSTYKIEPHVLNILKDMKKIGHPIGIFNHRLPEDNHGKATQLILKIINYIKAIKAGTFYRDIHLEEDWKNKWIKKYTDKEGYKTWREVKNLVVDSAQGYATEIESNKKIGGGLKYVKEIDRFFFNSPSFGDPGKSMFLKYMNIKPKSSKECIASFQKGKLPLNIQEKIDGFLKEQNQVWEGREELDWWSNMNQLYTWWKKNFDSLKEYNLAYHDNGFGYHCGSAQGFFNFVLKFLGNEIGYLRARPLSVDSGNAYWQRFRSWLVNGFNIEIFPDVERADRAGDVIEDRKSDAEENRIGDMMGILVVEAEERNIEATEEDLRKLALKRIAEEDERK